MGRDRDGDRDGDRDRGGGQGRGQGLGLIRVGGEFCLAYNAGGACSRELG